MTESESEHPLVRIANALESMAHSFERIAFPIMFEKIFPPVQVKPDDPTCSKYDVIG